MARADRNENRFDAPKDRRSGFPGLRGGRWESRDRFGRFTEVIARATGTPGFLLVLSVFVVAWIAYNTLAPEPLRFDSQALGFTVLTLILSLQASYAAPLILLAQNRQDDRDRIQGEYDRGAAERNQADVEYLTREIAALRMALGEVATRDYIRSELQRLQEELQVQGQMTPGPREPR
jgi:uncharacterized membrane protein